MADMDSVGTRTALASAGKSKGLVGRYEPAWVNDDCPFVSHPCVSASLLSIFVAYVSASTCDLLEFQLPFNFVARSSTASPFPKVATTSSGSPRGTCGRATLAN